MPKFTIQLEVSVVVAKSIKADDFAHATELAKEMAQFSGSTFVRPINGWGAEYDLDSKIIAVIA